VRIDERRREHESRPIDGVMTVPLERRTDRRDHAVVYPYVDLCVDAFARIEYAGTRDDERVLGRGLREEHHATPSGVAAAVSTSTGP